MINASAEDTEHYHLTDTERQEVEQLVECEAGADTEDGRMAVAQAIHDYCIDYGKTVDGAMRDLRCSTYKREITQGSKDAVKAVFDDDKRVCVSHIHVWYNPAWCISEWHENQVYVSTFGLHRFFTLAEYDRTHSHDKC